ncbi:MAG: LysE family translocator [Pseudomonadota bacterium]
MTHVQHFVDFVTVAAVMIATPGPSSALIVAVAAMRGIRAGLIVVAGILVAQTIQLTFVATGLVWLGNTYAGELDGLRYIGAAYMIYLGISAWRSAKHPSPSDAESITSAREGFIVGLFNPETLTIAATVFPEFVDTAHHPAPQYALLALTFTVLAVFLNSLQAVLGGIGNRLITSERIRVWVTRGGAVVLIIAGLFLAEAHA